MKKSETETFKENCKYLGLLTLVTNHESIIKQAHENNLGFFAFINQIVETEVNARIEKSIRYRIEKSKLPKPYKLLSDFDFNFQPRLKKRLIMDLATIDFIERKESILLIGNCGTGKSHIARSLALIACEKRYQVLYTACADMLIDLNRGVYEKTLNKRMRKYITCDLLLIDEMGHEIGHDRLELEVTKEAHLLFKIIDERYKQDKPIIFTTNIEETDWADYLGDPISTKAILDRIFHHSIKIEIKGPSYRKHESELLQQKYNTEQDEKTGSD
jgi:DNA replication protein DnaC